MFSVLSEVVTQGVKSDMLLLEDASIKTVDHRKRKPTSLGTTGSSTSSKHAPRETAQPSDSDSEEESPAATPPSPGPPKNEAKSLLD